MYQDEEDDGHSGGVNGVPLNSSTLLCGKGGEVSMASSDMVTTWMTHTCPREFILSVLEVVVVSRGEILEMLQLEDPHK